MRSPATPEVSLDEYNKVLTELSLTVRRIEKTGASSNEHGPKLVRRTRSLIEPAQKPTRSIPDSQQLEAMEVVPNAKSPGSPMRSLDM